MDDQRVIVAIFRFILVGHISLIFGLSFINKKNKISVHYFLDFNFCMNVQRENNFCHG